MSSNEDHRDLPADDAYVTEQDMLLSALDTLNGGLIILDSELRIVVANKLSGSLLDVPEELLKPGSP
jgi:PAS domain-containing protein